jgi:hypothetical protein
MKGVDTNILVYAHRAESAEHQDALSLLSELATGNDLWAIAWPSFYEFVRVVTHTQIFTPPSKLEKALAFLESLVASPTLRLLGHGPGHWDWMKQLMEQADARGNLAFDAQIAALFIEHGVSQIITKDGDFRRFRELEVYNPF